MLPAPSLAEAPPNKSDDRRPLSHIHTTSESHRPSVVAAPPSADHASHADPDASPPLRKDTNSSISTAATALTTAGLTTDGAAGTPLTSVNSSPTYPQPTQGVFSARDGSNVPPQRRPTRRRVGPLTAVQRERAHLIRKMGACADCRRRRVACHPNHHNMTWEEAARRFRSHEPSHELPPIRGTQLSPTTLTSGQEPRAMDIDPPLSHPPSQPSQNEGRIRTPLPSGPRPDKQLLPPLPGFDTFRADLQGSVDRILANPFRSRYAHVSVLMIRWQDDDDTETRSALEELARLFQEDYGYAVYVKPIPRVTDESRNPSLWLTNVLGEFLSNHDQRDCLKIFYYAGYCYLDPDRQPVLASSRHSDPTATIRWGVIRQIFDEALSDILLLMDCAYYPSYSMARRKQGMLELVAASAGEDHVEMLGRGVFTRALANELKGRAAQGFREALTTAELHSRLLAVYSGKVKERNPNDRTVLRFPTPLIMQLSAANTLPSILLAPRRHQGQGHQGQPQGHGAGPSSSSSSISGGSQHITITFRLADDAFNLDKWAEWLRNMPPGITEAQVNGPYRNTFQ